MIGASFFSGGQGGCHRDGFEQQAAEQKLIHVEVPLHDVSPLPHNPTAIADVHCNGDATAVGDQSPPNRAIPCRPDPPIPGRDKITTAEKKKEHQIQTRRLVFVLT